MHKKQSFVAPLNVSCFLCSEPTIAAHGLNVGYDG